MCVFRDSSPEDCIPRPELGLDRHLFMLAHFLGLGFDVQQQQTSKSTVIVGGCAAEEQSHLSEVNVYKRSGWGISVEGAFVLRLQHHNCCHSWDLASTVLGLILLLSSFPRFPALERDVFIPVPVFIFSCCALVPGVSPDERWVVQRGGGG